MILSALLLNGSGQSCMEVFSEIGGFDGCRFSSLGLGSLVSLILSYSFHLFKMILRIPPMYSFLLCTWHHNFKCYFYSKEHNQNEERPLLCAAKHNRSHLNCFACFDGQNTLLENAVSESVV